jgi:DNA ligase-1
MHEKFYRLDSKGKVRLWEIKVTGNLIETWDGVLDGKLKYTPDTVSEGKNIGKANETTPEEQALLNAERKVT